MSAARSALAVAEFYTETLPQNFVAARVPLFYLPYFRDDIERVVMAPLREAAEFDEFVESLADDPEIRALLAEEES